MDPRLIREGNGEGRRGRTHEVRFDTIALYGRFGKIELCFSNLGVADEFNKCADSDDVEGAHGGDIYGGIRLGQGDHNR